MKHFSNCIQELLSVLDIDQRKIAQTAFNQQVYKNAVFSIWKSHAAADMILQRTNAFYIRRDETLKLKKSYLESDRGEGSASGDVVCEIYVEDSMVLSELDTHKEILTFALRSNELSFDELRLIHSKGQMRTRHPFAKQENNA